ncbi:hypothetical protein Tco_0470357, partial [Tanacetum coccineum]
FRIISNIHQIPPKKIRGKGSQGKKTTNTHVEEVEVSEESDLEPTKRKISYTHVEGTGSIPGVPDESTVVSATSREGTGAKPGVLDKEKDITEEKVILEWGD